MVHRTSSPLKTTSTANATTTATAKTTIVGICRNGTFPFICLASGLTLLVLQYIVLSFISMNLDDARSSSNGRYLQQQQQQWSDEYLPRIQNIQNNDKYRPINVNKDITDSSRSTTGITTSSIESTEIMDFPSSGILNLDPTLHRQCVTIRFRGDVNNYTVDDAITVLAQKYVTNPGPRSLRMGIMIMEDVDTFLPVRVRERGNLYHMFHFVEMMVMAYIELLRISNTLPVHAGYGNTFSQRIAPTSLAKGSPSITVPWIFSPYMSPLEICGGYTKINCVIADMIFRGSKSSIFTDRTGIVGLDAMEQYPFDYTNDKMKGIGHRIELAKYVYGNHPTLLDDNNAADGVIMIERFGCNMGGINKPWSGYIDSFSPYSWHSDLLLGLGRTWDSHRYPIPSESSSKKRFVLGYIDRQNTDRRLPEEHHNWLIQYATTHKNIDFRQLHMEDYDAVQQIEIASECDMMIGMHGNGMTHTLWMQPRRYVIEYFWKYNFQYDYATIAHLMNHTYMALLNGKVVDTTRIENRDPLLRKSPTRKEAQRAPIHESMQSFETDGKIAIQLFIEKAIYELSL